MNITNYPILKSRTFWTQTIQQLYNFLVPLLNVFPNNIWLTFAVNVVGLVLTVFFHVQGVNNAAMASVTGGKPLSGK